MNPFFVLTLLFALVGCSPKQDFERINKAQVDLKMVSLSKNLAQKIMNGQKSHNYYLLKSNEAENPMVEGLTIEVQKAAYQSIKSIYGDFDSLQFVEAWQHTNADKSTIYRFKGYFNETNKQPEVRVVLSPQNKLAGFWIKQWYDGI